MNPEAFLKQPGEWLRGDGPESDVVVSCRVRLARNLHRFPFLTVATKEVRGDIEGFLRGRFQEHLAPLGIHYVPMASLAPVDRTLLVERHLVSRELAADGEAGSGRGVALRGDESLSIMVNEEDHLRLQVLRSGLQLEQAWEEADRIDSLLEGHLNYAFHPRFGYLTACPTNAGTGLRLSVMVHLPASVLAKQVDRMLQALARLNYTVRGLYGEGTSPVGDLYQISNQVTLGRSEKDLIVELRKVLPELLKFERSWRSKLAGDRPLEDRVWRAFATLKHARRISSEETLEHLSHVRLGVHLGLLKGLPLSLVNELLLYSQPAHLQKLQGRLLAEEERDGLRADYLRSKLAALPG